MARIKNVDMLHGPISIGLITMFMPILIMNVMTTLFTVVDMTVLRIYADDGAVGSVGASGNIAIPSFSSVTPFTSIKNLFSSDST